MLGLCFSLLLFPYAISSFFSWLVVLRWGFFMLLGWSWTIFKVNMDCFDNRSKLIKKKTTVPTPKLSLGHRAGSLLFLEEMYLTPRENWEVNHRRSTISAMLPGCWILTEGIREKDQGCEGREGRVEATEGRHPLPLKSLANRTQEGGMSQGLNWGHISQDPWKLKSQVG